MHSLERYVGKLPRAHTHTHVMYIKNNVVVIIRKIKLEIGVIGKWWLHYKLQF